MEKLDALEQLLPGFQQFLSDLTTCKLTSALEAQVDKYNQNIQDYIEQHCTIPKSSPPDPPKAQLLNGSLTDFAAEQRELARKAHHVPEQQQGGIYYNETISTDTVNANNGMETYEEPTRSPAVPTSKRPPQRQIQDDLEVYEEPDDAPTIKPTGKSATLPLPSRQAFTEALDSGGTTVSFNSSSSSQQYDEGEVYEDVPDAIDEFDDTFFSGTDYEDYDEDELEKNQKVDSNANKAKKSSDKSKMAKEDKLALFKGQHEGDPKVDHLGLLYISNKVVTVSKKSITKWDKRYCLAKDLHLLCYKNYGSKKPAQDFVLFGYTVTFVGQEGKQQNVFTVSHPSRGTEYLGAETKEDADKWIEVLQGYATMKNELTPSSGFVEKEGQGQTSHTEDITKKFLGLFTKRDKKSKDNSPQLAVDKKGVLSGYINIMGSANYGEPKWRKKYLVIQKGELECYSEDGERLDFHFLLSGTDMAEPDSKAAKGKAAMRIVRGSETLIHIETLNIMDLGPLLKKLHEEMVPDLKKDASSSSKTGMVSSLLKAFEINEPGDQQNQNYDVIYEDTDVPIRQNSNDSVSDDKEKEKSAGKNSPSSIYQNFKIVLQRDGKKKSETLPAKIGKALEDADSGKKDKKAKKKEEKKQKKDKKGKGKEVEVVTKEEEVVAKEVEEAPGENVGDGGKKKESVRRRTVSAFEKSDKSHLLDVDRLEIERKEVEEKRRVVTKRKIDLRNERREATDPKQKELLDAELQKVQQEWSTCNNRLAFINSEIERFSKGGGPDTKEEKKERLRMSIVEEMSFKDPMMVRRTRDRLSLCASRSWSLDSASAEIVRKEISSTQKKEQLGATSPGLKVARGGNVSDMRKMFER
ncbi:actin filament-associated protein 1-like 2 isoform X2 [Acanthaster planci]|uniref:Actin filament-associated protein 1-like 2 isoform X2 n=1 Tax=Acanthaster planci TaxID=133434 RepID=A0A8B7YFC5_ACAPL|nr:actin filament-associated protein 1-like 2 isoform X2 [Acanthaster planci]